MWKRFLVVLIALVGTFSVVYAANSDLFAASSNYNAGGNVTGRVNKAPSNLNVTEDNIGLRAYDTLQMNTLNAYANKPLSWKLIEKHTYTDYWLNGNQCTAAETAPTETVRCDNPQISAWYSLSNDPIGNMNPGGTESLFIANANQPSGKHFYYNTMTLNSAMKSFNNLITSNDTDKKYLTYRDLSLMHDVSISLFERGSFALATANSTASFLSAKEETQNNAFTPGYTSVEKGYAFGSPYFLNQAYHNGGSSVYAILVVDTNGEVIPSNLSSNSALASSGFKADLRPGAYLLDSVVDNIVFAVSNGSASGFASVNENGNAPMKPRAYDSRLSITLDDIVKNNQGDALSSSKLSQNSIVYLKGTANNSAIPDCNISVTIFNDKGEFVYYKPLTSSYINGSNYFKFDTAGLPIGKYQVALVNEKYNENVSGEASSSLISNVKPLEIVAPLSNVPVTNTPQPGASVANTYEYSKNVSQGTQVATFTTTGGSSDHFTYELIADPSKPENALDFKKFEIKNQTIVVKEASGLNAGNYYFKIKVNDLNASVESPIHIYVEKTTATVDFKDGSQITNNTQRDMITNGSMFTGTINTTNTDLNGAVSTTKKPEYTLASRNASNALSLGTSTDIDKYILDVVSNPSDTSKLPDIYTLSVKIPETDNYKESNQVSRTFRVYKELNTLEFKGNGSGTNKTNFTTTQAMANYSIGALSVKDGIKDVNSRYTFAATSPSDGEYYDAVKAEHNDKVKILEDTKEVVLKEKLLPDTYSFQFKVTDSVGKTIYADVSITVSAVDQAQFSFKKTAGGPTIGTLSDSYALNKEFQLYAEGGTGSGAITYKIAEGQPMNVIKVDALTGKVIIQNASSQSVKVVAKKSGGDNYKDAEATIDITITEGHQELHFEEDTRKHSKISDGTFNVLAKVSNRPDSSMAQVIKYTSSDESICTVGETSGIVTPKTKVKNTCKITAVNEDVNYVRAEESVSIEFYEDLTAGFEQSLNPVVIDTPKDTIVAKIINTRGGDGSYTYEFKDNTNPLTIDQKSGVIKLSKNLETGDLMGKWNTNAGNYMFHEIVTVTDGSGQSIEINVDILCQGATLKASFNNATNGIIHETFTNVGGTFNLSLKDNISKGDVTYSLTSNDSVILDDILPDGEVSIKKASNNDDEYAEVKAVIAPKDGYMGQELTVKIIIDKATQTIAFTNETPSQKAFEDKGTFTIEAVSTPADASITYSASPSSVCTIAGNMVTMVGKGTCKVEATATRANYNDTSTTKDITLYQGVGGEFRQTYTTLEAKGNDETIKTDPLLVGHIEANGGASDKLEYFLSSKTGDENAASSLFSVSQTDGDVSLLQEVKAEILEQFATYDTTENVYLLKIQVDVVNGSDTKTIPCVIKIKGAPLKNLSFDKDTNNIITKTYTEDNTLKFFNLEATGNDGSGPITYSLKSGSDIPSDIIKLSGTGNKKVEIMNADEKHAIVIADIEQSKGYAKTQSEVKVKVNKAQLTDFNFVDTNPSWLLQGSSVAPEFTKYPSGSTIKLESSDTTVISIDGNSLKAEADGKDITISATTPLDTDTVLYRNYEQKTVTKTYHVYSSLGGEINITARNMQADTKTANKGKLIGTLDVFNGQGPISKTITKGLDCFALSDSGILTLNKAITKDDLTWDATKKVYYIPLEITVQDNVDTVVLSKNVEFIGASLNELLFKDATNDVISQPYEADGQYQLELKATDDAPFTGNVTYRLKNGVDDTGVVLGIDANGLVYMGEASEGAGDVIIEAVVDPQNGYTGAILECIFEITQIDQDFEFTENPITLSVNDKTPHSISFKNTSASGRPTLSIAPAGFAKITGTTARPTLTAESKGTATLSATDAGDRNYKERTVTTTVTVYDKANIILDLGAMPQAETDTSKINSPVGEYHTEGGLDIVDVDLDTTLADNQYFKLLNNTLVFNKDINASILNTHPYDENKKAYVMQVVFTLTDGTGVPIKSSPQDVYIKGASLSNIAFKDKDGNATDTIYRNYAEKQFVLELTGKVGNTWPYGEVTYTLQTENSPNADGKSTIIESIDPVTGITKILNANLTAGPGSDEIARAKATIKAAKGYDEQEVTSKIVINKANQPDFRFGSMNYSVELNNTMNVELKDKLSSGPVIYDIKDESKVSYDANTDMFKGLALGTTQITATTDTNDRNYNPAQAQTTIQVIEGAADILTIQIDQGSTVTYGDTGVTASIKNSTVTGTVTGQKWSSSNTEVATIEEATGAITIIGRGQTQIALTQTIEGRDIPVHSQEVTLNVKRKILYVKIADAEKFVGEDMPNFTIESVVGLVGSDTFIAPIFICLDGDDNIVNSYTGVGEYEIKGIFNENDNPNYTLKVDNGATSTVTNGMLRVKQDGSDPSWYTVRSDANPTEVGWYKSDVHLDLVEGHDYDKISDKIDGTYDKSIPVQEEGIHDKDIYFKASRNNAIAAPQEATVKVDQTNPKITSVAGKTINDNTFARVMNTLTLNAFFKPGSEITIDAQDIAPQTGVTTSGIAKIDYEVYSETADEEGNTLIKAGSEASDRAIFTIDDLGDYNICATATDNAGNVSPQTCQKATVSKIDVDVDGDGKPDFNDPNEDGCADLNIKWKDPNDPNKWIIINGDRDYDGIPDLNVDSDGDGKPNLNIDTDGDNLPDINLVILKKGDWTAGTCIIGEAEEYSGGTTSVKPQINIDTDDDRVPNIDIDTNGDMKANINISKNGKANVNIAIVHKPWVAEADFTFKTFSYDTNDKLKPYLNIDTNDDGIPDVNVDVDGDDIADINIDTDGDEKPDVDIDSDGDGIPDINIDDDGDGDPDREIIDIPEWNPDFKVDINDDLSYGTVQIKRNDFLKDQGIILRSGTGKKFLPNYALRVIDITNEKKSTLDNYVFKDSDERDLCAVYELSFLRNDEPIPLDEEVVIQVPIDSDIKDTKFYLQESGSDEFVPVTVKEEDEYYSFTTTSLGDLAILGTTDKEIEHPQNPKVDDSEDATDQTGGAIAGSNTGDATDMQMLFYILISCGIGLLALKKCRKDLN